MLHFRLLEFLPKSDNPEVFDIFLLALREPYPFLFKSLLKQCYMYLTEEEIVSKSPHVKRLPPLVRQPRPEESSASSVFTTENPESEDDDEDEKNYVNRWLQCLEQRERVVNGERRDGPCEHEETGVTSCESSSRYCSSSTGPDVIQRPVSYMEPRACEHEETKYYRTSSCPHNCNGCTPPSPALCAPQTEALHQMSQRREESFIFRFEIDLDGKLSSETENLRIAGHQPDYDDESYTEAHSPGGSLAQSPDQHNLVQSSACERDAAQSSVQPPPNQFFEKCDAAQNPIGRDSDQSSAESNPGQGSGDECTVTRDEPREHSAGSSDESGSSCGESNDTIPRWDKTRQQSSLSRKGAIRRRSSGVKTPRHPPKAQTYPTATTDSQKVVVQLKKGNEGFGFTFIHERDRPRERSNSDFYITKILPGSPADLCGKIDVNDTILMIDGIGEVGDMPQDLVNDYLLRHAEIVLILGKHKANNRMSYFV